MSHAINGGPAFPHWDNSAIHRIGAAAVEGIEDSELRDAVYIRVTAEASQGMMLRDYFAARAMQGLISAHSADGEWTGLENQPDKLAAISFNVADAMLRARGQS